MHLCFFFIAAHERERGIPPNYLNRSMSVLLRLAFRDFDHQYSTSVSRGAQDAFQRFGRGELSLFQFYEAFGRDLSDTVNGNIHVRSRNYGRLANTVSSRSTTFQRGSPGSLRLSSRF